MGGGWKESRLTEHNKKSEAKTKYEMQLITYTGCPRKKYTLFKIQLGFRPIFYQIEMNH